MRRRVWSVLMRLSFGRRRRRIRRAFAHFLACEGLGFCAAKDLQETRQLAPSLVQAWEVWWRLQRHSRVVDLTATLAWEDLCFVLA